MELRVPENPVLRPLELMEGSGLQVAEMAFATLAAPTYY
jgi:hypothetical protein